MIEHKFRVFIDNKFYYFSLNQIMERSLTYQGDWDIKALRAEKQQSACVNDKKGKEIYAGDIIQHHFDKSAVGVVTYGEYGNNIGFFVEWISGRHKDLLLKNLVYWASMTEVIGNITENQQLLEFKQ